MMRVVHAFFAVTFGLSLAAVPTAAQQQRPGIWQDEAERVQELIDEIRPLIERSRQARAADPRFLDDLEAVLGRYDSPWRAPLLADDFGDGDYTRNPAWTVHAGEFSIHPRRGLLSRVDPAVASRRYSRDAGTRIAQGQYRPYRQLRADAAEISARLEIPNAFSIRLQLTSLGNAGRLLIGPYQGGDRRAGYRLAYNPGGRPSLELLRVGRRYSPTRTRTTTTATSADLESALARLAKAQKTVNQLKFAAYPPRTAAQWREDLAKAQAKVGRIRAELASAPADPVSPPGSSVTGAPATFASPAPNRGVIETHDQPVALRDGRPHLLEWIRTSDGTMTVSIDSRELMRVRDQRFRDPFDGFTLINRGGDYAVRWIRITGTP